jgi:hypothetical protein
MYEMAYWADTALSGAECAQLGGGSAEGIALPTHYWPLISDAVALYGGVNGTMTGATDVAHSGANLYPIATGPRRGSLLLTGVGCRPRRWPCDGEEP